MRAGKKNGKFGAWSSVTYTFKNRVSIKKRKALPDIRRQSLPPFPVSDFPARSAASCLRARLLDVKYLMW
jgi:hypothetical protein